ncbi:DASH family cryptochrome [Halopseudomonas salina]|uniref:Cryptochrome DASH n=1 Tax=Halopseudomonas salina TaxID=1323744 RepID=A0ABQ1P9H2_9GAMM|nr:DASH family cryptochrome [Halopseudomonas salina]GGC93461.1 cryptochrome DASH [Halopseudomonas salina]
MTNLLWFKQDLRVDDNPVLAAAMRGTDCLPVYCLDPRWFEPDHLGLLPCGPRRAQFILESLADLRRSLRTLGSDLLVLQGKPEELLPALCIDMGIQAVYTHAEHAPDEQALMDRLHSALPNGVDLQVLESNGLFEPTELPFSLEAMPGVFTRFRNKIEKHPPAHLPISETTVMAPLPVGALDLIRGIPGPADLGLQPCRADHRSALPAGGGELAGREWLDDYLWGSQSVRHYKETRNELLGKHFSSKLSTWLSHGCLSPRRVVQELRAHEVEHGANDSTYWLWFELLWREFFRLSLRVQGSAFFRFGGLQNGTPPRGADQRWLDWREGNTGQPFVDACLRELNASGFLSNRGRQIAASYLIHDLKQDWRLGAAWFEQQLIDYDVASNWGNWAYIAGVGHDPRGGRAFNVAMQAERHDPQGAYVATWAE